MSKTKEAMALVDQGVAPFAAAKQVGMAPSTLYVALKKRREKEQGHCPCCGQKLPAEK